MSEFVVRNSMTARQVLGRLKEVLGGEDNLWTDLDDELADASDNTGRGFFCFSVKKEGVAFKYWSNNTEFINRIQIHDPPTPAEYTDIREIKRALRGKL